MGSQTDPEASEFSEAKAPSRRFDGRASVYDKYRPRYPSSILGILAKESGFSRDTKIADIGSGTGILSNLFLSNGNVVYCVEPNEDMRLAAERNLAHYGSRFISLKGRAESTGIPDGLVDLVVIGQALHWFDFRKTNREIRRILKNPGYVCIVYNDRKEDDEVGRDYSRIVKTYGKNSEHIPNANDEFVSRFFLTGAPKKFVLPNSQVLNYNGFLGRLASASYMPGPKDKDWLYMAKDVEGIFSRKGGESVKITYETRVYIGRPSQEG